jgi:hypothetical protein
MICDTNQQTVFYGVVLWLVLGLFNTPVSNEVGELMLNKKNRDV